MTKVICIEGKSELGLLRGQTYTLRPGYSLERSHVRLQEFPDDIRGYWRSNRFKPIDNEQEKPKSWYVNNTLQRLIDEANERQQTTSAELLNLRYAMECVKRVEDLEMAKKQDPIPSTKSVPRIIQVSDSYVLLDFGDETFPSIVKLEKLTKL